MLPRSSAAYVSTGHGLGGAWGVALPRRRIAVGPEHGLYSLLVPPYAPSVPYRVRHRAIAYQDTRAFVSAPRLVAAYALSVPDISLQSRRTMAHSRQYRTSRSNDVGS
eukprot:3125773-Rhodomonas_salina.1